MSEMVTVSFGLSPYEHAQRLGYADCLAVASMQIDGREPYKLQAKGATRRDPATSVLEMELPRETVEATYDFLRVHDAVRQTFGPEVAHSNCHIASGTARRWIKPDTVQPALIEGYKLEEDEVERVNPKDLSDLEPGEVYAFTSRVGRQYRWLHPTHSIMQLPGGLHFSQLGWRGNPYIGGLSGAVNYFSGNQEGFYHVVRKPRDIDTLNWYERVLEHSDRVDDVTLNQTIEQFRRIEQVARGVGRIPTQRSAELV